MWLEPRWWTAATRPATPHRAHLGDHGSAGLGLSFVLALTALLAGMPAHAQSNTAALVAECDRLAASDLDFERPPEVPGVAFSKIDAPAAVAACLAAAKVRPTDPRITFELGRAYQAAKDYEKARAQYERADQLGNDVATNNLAALLGQGLGGPKDGAKARQLFEKAAASGINLAKYSLGRMYEDGDGVPQHFVLAWHWYEAAAATGDARAMTRLGVFCQKGLAVGKDYDAARGWYEKAAALGESSSMALLGVLYEDGLGVTRNLDTARHWYEMAASAGNTLAKELLSKLTPPGTNN
jgi:TPR repeat protein